MADFETVRSEIALAARLRSSDCSMLTSEAVALLAALDAATARAERAEAALAVFESGHFRLGSTVAVADYRTELAEARAALQASEKRRGEVEAENARLCRLMREARDDLHGRSVLFSGAFLNACEGGTHAKEEA